MKKTTRSDVKAQLDEQRKERKKRTTLRVKCGSCIFFRSKCDAFEAPCQDLGKKRISPGCNHFNPDYTQARLSRPDVIKDIGAMVRHMPDSIKHLVAYALVNSGELERASEALMGFTVKLGQPIVVNLSAPRVDFVNCYFSGIALGVTQDKRGLIVVSEISGKWSHVIMPLNSGAILSRTMWKKHKAKLVKKKLINADNPGLKSILPTIDPKLIKNHATPAVAKAPAKLRKAEVKTAIQKKRTYKVSKKKTGKVITI